MKRVIGFALLCMAVGMFIIMMLPSTSILRFLLFIGCITAGYFLFCK